MRSKFFANEFAHIHGLQSETGTPARNALSEHYPTTGLKIPLTVRNSDTSRKGFGDPADPPCTSQVKKATQNTLRQVEIASQHLELGAKPCKNN